MERPSLQPSQEGSDITSTQRGFDPTQKPSTPLDTDSDVDDDQHQNKQIPPTSPTPPQSQHSEFGPLNKWSTIYFDFVKKPEDVKWIVPSDTSSLPRKTIKTSNGTIFVQVGDFVELNDGSICLINDVQDTKIFMNKCSRCDYNEIRIHGLWDQHNKSWLSNQMAGIYGGELNQQQVKRLLLVKDFNLHSVVQFDINLSDAWNSFKLKNLHSNTNEYNPKRFEEEAYIKECIAEHFNIDSYDVHLCPKSFDSQEQGRGQISIRCKGIDTKIAVEKRAKFLLRELSYLNQVSGGSESKRFENRFTKTPMIDFLKTRMENMLNVRVDTLEISTLRVAIVNRQTFDNFHISEVSGELTSFPQEENEDSRRKITFFRSTSSSSFSLPFSSALPMEKKSSSPGATQSFPGATQSFATSSSSSSSNSKTSSSSSSSSSSNTSTSSSSSSSSSITPHPEDIFWCRLLIDPDHNRRCGPRNMDVIKDHWKHHKACAGKGNDYSERMMNQLKKSTKAELFAGIGLNSRGNNYFKTTFANEQDEFAWRVLKRNEPEAARNNHVIRGTLHYNPGVLEGFSEDVPWGETSCRLGYFVTKHTPTLVSASPPCQLFSAANAGGKKGVASTNKSSNEMDTSKKNPLVASTLLRCILAYRPLYVEVEEVPAFFTSSTGIEFVQSLNNAGFSTQIVTMQAALHGDVDASSNEIYPLSRRLRTICLVSRGDMIPVQMQNPRLNSERAGQLFNGFGSAGVARFIKSTKLTTRRNNGSDFNKVKDLPLGFRDRFVARCMDAGILCDRRPAQEEMGHVSHPTSYKLKNRTRTDIKSCSLSSKKYVSNTIMTRPKTAGRGANEILAPYEDEDQIRTITPAEGAILMGITNLDPGEPDCFYLVPTHEQDETEDGYYSIENKGKMWDQCFRGVGNGVTIGMARAYGFDLKRAALASEEMIRIEYKNFIRIKETSKKAAMERKRDKEKQMQEANNQGEDNESERDSKRRRT